MLILLLASGAAAAGITPPAATDAVPYILTQMVVLTTGR